MSYDLYKHTSKQDAQITVSLKMEILEKREPNDESIISF